MTKGKITICLSFLLILFFSISANAETNGLWTYAKDIRGGTFGSDENLENFNFNSSVNFNSPVNINADLNVNSNNGVNMDKLTIDNLVIKKGDIGIDLFSDKTQNKTVIRFNQLNKKAWLGFEKSNDIDFKFVTETGGFFGFYGGNVYISKNLEALGTIKSTSFIGNGTYVTDVNAKKLNNQLPSYYLDNTDNQILTISNGKISISGGNEQTLPVDGDGNSANELNTDFSLTGNILSIKDNGGTKSVDLSSYLDDTTLTKQTVQQWANEVDDINDADSSATNELQDLNGVLTRGTSAGNKKITSLANPTSAQDAATKNYVDEVFGSLCAVDGTDLILKKDATMTFYSQPSVSYSQDCSNYKQDRTCTNGALTGENIYNSISCKKDEPRDCGTTPHGSTKSFSKESLVEWNENCETKAFVCNDGNFNNYGYPAESCSKKIPESCTVNALSYWMESELGGDPAIVPVTIFHGSTYTFYSEKKCDAYGQSTIELGCTNGLVTGSGDPTNMYDNCREKMVCYCNSEGCTPDGKTQMPDGEFDISQCDECRDERFGDLMACTQESLDY